MVALTHLALERKKGAFIYSMNKDRGGRTLNHQKTCFDLGAKATGIRELVKRGEET